MAFVDDWILTRDKVGTVARWDLHTLRLLDRLDARALADSDLLLEGEEPSPMILHGMGVWDGKLYVNNGYMQVAVIDIETFVVDDIRIWPHGDAMLDWFCTDAPGLHAVSSRDGEIFLGSLRDWDFPLTAKVDEGNIHRVRYDVRHRRYWATLDSGIGETHRRANGVLVMGLDGEVAERDLFARNDVECLEFSPDYSRVYVGGFDGKLIIYDNTQPRLRPLRTVTNFSHQIIDCTVDDAGSVFVLTQDGEVVRLGPEGAFEARFGYLRGCVWDLRPIPGAADSLLAATDDGIALLRLVERVPGQPALTVEGRYRTGLGYTRRLVAGPDAWFGIAWERSIFRMAPGGALDWAVQADGRVFDVVLSPDGGRILVASHDGGAELDVSTGEILWHVDTSGPAWACAYLSDGRRLLAQRDGRMAAYTADGHAEPIFDLHAFPKRVLETENGLRVAGFGGIKELTPGATGLDKQFVELLENTVENCVVADGTVCATGFGMQIAAYDYDTGELLHFAEDLPDFTKGMALLFDSNGRPLVVVGGRGNFLRLYRLDRQNKGRVLTAIRDLWLSPDVPTETPMITAGSQP